MAAGSVVRAELSELDALSQTLARSFHTAPLFRWLLADQADPAAKLLVSMRALLRVALARSDHRVDTIGDGTGVAIWFGADRWRFTKRESVRLLPSAIETYGKRLPLAGKTSTMIEAAHPTEPHRYLSYIGVDPERQGQGIGTDLLAAATASCDRDGVPAYLENLDPRNAPLYERFGFVDRGPISLPNGAPIVTAMWRDPA